MVFDHLKTLWNAALLCIIISTTAKSDETFQYTKLRGIPRSTSIAFSSDGKQIAFGFPAREKSLPSVWLRSSDKDGEAVKYECDDGSNSLWDVTVNPTTKRVFAATSKGSIFRWDIDGQSAKAIAEPSMRLISLAVSPDGKWGATLNAYGELAVWNSGFDKQLATLVVAKFDVGSVLFTPDSSVVYAVCRGTIVSWDHINRKTIAQCFPRVERTALGTYDDSFIRADLSTDGAQLIASCASGRVVLMDAKTLRLKAEHVPDLRTNHPTRCVRFVNDNKFALVTSNEPYLLLLSIPSLESVATGVGPEKDAKCCHGLAVGNQGELIVAACGENNYRIKITLTDKLKSLSR